MKKFIFLIITAVMLTGCTSPAVSQSEETESTTAVPPNGREAVDIKNPNEVFTEGDFTLYAENGLAIISLGMDKDLAEKRLESFANYMGEFEVKYYDTLVQDPEDQTKTITQSNVRYIAYRGYLNPVYTSKGVYTTGKDGKDGKNASVDKVIEGYEIDKDNESYISNQNDEKNYCIELLYDENDTRIISPKGTDLSTVEAKKVIRFLITDNLVKGVDLYEKH